MARPESACSRVARMRTAHLIPARFGILGRRRPAAGVFPAPNGLLVNRPAALLAGALSIALVAGSTAVADARSTRRSQAVHVSSTHHVVAPVTVRPGLVDL